MPIEISEMRPSDRQEVAQLLETSANPPSETSQLQNASEPSGDTPPPPAADNPIKNPMFRCDNVLSLVAREEGQLVGVILCRRDGIQGHLHNVTVAPSHKTTDLDKALIDKALGKLNARGSNKTRIKLPTGPEHAPFWDVVKWSNIEELDADPVRSSAVTERLAAGRYEDSDDQKAADSPAEAAADTAAASPSPEPAVEQAA